MGYEGLHIGKVGDIQRLEAGGAAGGADFAGKGFQTIGAAGAKNDAGTGGGQISGGRLANAAAPVMATTFP